MERARCRGANFDFQSRGPLRFSRCLGASVAAERIETAPKRRSVFVRHSKT